MGFWSSVGSAISSGFSAVCSAVSSIGGAAIGFARECLPKVGSILATVGGSLGMVANLVVAVCQIFSTLRQDEKAEDLGDRALQAAENGIRPENFDHYQDYLEHDRGMYCDYEKAAPGYKAETFEALMEEFERLVQGDDHFKEVRRQARDFFYCKEGQGMVGETLLGILKNIK